MTPQKIIIMAGGTGGHIYPALAVAKALIDQGHHVTWLGTTHGMENTIVPKHGIELDQIPIRGLRGNGLLGWLKMPWRLFKATYLARKILKQRKADLIVGFGGFVAGPGGLAARSLRKPLIIHEQNAIFGMTNRYLSKLAVKTFCAFDNARPKTIDYTVIGNPIRKDILNLKKTPAHDRPLHLLVVGGSLGSLPLNQTVPQALTQISTGQIEVKHQAGSYTLKQAKAAYQNCSHPYEVLEFIDDMAAAYEWADLVICRAGALTVSEIAAAGMPAIFIPHPHVVDDHQTANAHWLSDQNAAICLPQSGMSETSLSKLIQGFIDDRKALEKLGMKAKLLAKTGATEAMANAISNLRKT